MAKHIKNAKIVACLDMGSSKLVCIIAAINGDEVQILGYSHKESKGIIGSAISDMRLAQKSITNVVSQAERMAGFNIDRLLVGISGSQVVSTHKEVSTKIASDIVKNSDISSLATKIRGEYKKKNREIIHLIPLQYRIDDSTPVTNPRYMSGETLHAKFHVVSTSQTTIRNIENCLRRCQLSVNNYIVEPYASALSCLSDNEINLGSLMIDIGGSSTSFSLLSDGKLIYIGNSPLGGMHITKDISTILNISFNEAEKVKNLNSSLLISPIEERDSIKYKNSDDNQSEVMITRAQMRDIIQCRLEEIFESVRDILKDSGIPVQMLSNIIISGGVTSIVGIDKLASDIFEKNVRIGYPNKIDSSSIPSEILSPTHSCSLGMLIFLKNLYLKEKLKDGFETKNNWFRRLIEKLAAI